MKNILIIEKDEDALGLLKEILEDNGYQVFATTSLEKGISIVSQGVKIDLLLFSLFFENNINYKGIEEFKAHTQVEIPIIAIISSLETDEGKMALALGCVDVLAKPFDEDEIEKSLIKFESNFK